MEFIYFLKKYFHDNNFYYLLMILPLCMSIILFLTLLKHLLFSESAEVEGRAKDSNNIAHVLGVLQNAFDFVQKTQESSSDDYGVKGSSHYIAIDMEVSNSWLEAPPPETHSSDQIGTFPVGQIWPSSDKGFTPAGVDSDVEKVLNHKIPNKIKDDELRKFLSSKSLAQNYKINLNDSVFDPPFISMDKNAINNTIDGLARRAIVENALAKQILSGAKDRLEGMLGKWDSIEEGVKYSDSLSKEDIYNEFNLLFESLKMSKVALNRNFHQVSSIFASNKIHWRKAVLDRCSGSTITKQKMQLSSLNSPSLFGPLPESYARRLDHSLSATASSLMLKPSKQPVRRSPLSTPFSTPKRGFLKRKSNFSYGNQPKRFNNSPENVQSTSYSQSYSQPRQDNFHKKRGRGRGHPRGASRRGGRN